MDKKPINVEQCIMMSFTNMPNSVFYDLTGTVFDHLKLSSDHIKINYAGDHIKGTIKIIVDPQYSTHIPAILALISESFENNKSMVSFQPYEME